MNTSSQPLLKPMDKQLDTYNMAHILPAEAATML